MVTNSFYVGDRVCAVAIAATEYSPGRAAVPGLIVDSVRRVESSSGFPTYYRVHAVTADGLWSVEGAERFFDLELRGAAWPSVKGADNV